MPGVAASDLKSSPARCWIEPRPAWPYERLPGFVFAERDELFESCARQRRMHRDAQRIGDDAGDRIEIFHRIVERLRLEQRLVDVRLRAAEEQRVAVGLRARDRRGADRRPAAADVLDDDRAEQRLHLLGPRPADRVERAARRERNDQPDRARRIGLRDQQAAKRRQRRGRSRALHESTAGKRHACSFIGLFGEAHEQARVRRFVLRARARNPESFPRAARRPRSSRSP